MQRYIGLLAAAIVAVAVFFFAVGVRERHVAVIGVVQFTPTNLKTLEGLKDGLAALGHVEGRNVTYLSDGPIPTREALEPAVKKLVRQKPDLLFVSTTPAAQAAKKLTVGSSIPVLFAPVNDPVAAGLVRHMQHPEGNLTGVRLSPSDGRRLQELLEFSPGVRRVFVPYDPEDASSRVSMETIRNAARTLDLELVAKPLAADTDPAGDASYVPEDADAIFLPRASLVLTRIKAFTAIGIARGIPVCSLRLAQVEQGATMGYGYEDYEAGKQAARLAHLILTGTPVANLPVETSQDSLFVNMDTARKSGITVSDAYLRRAHTIIRSSDEARR